ncbi:MAG: SPOR domain-containing protein [Acidobacteriia bacterium]|nr:SPOR domain-containing protein [Terriglobia bacterium]
MASRGGKSGGDFVLESRHLVGLFLLLVVIFGVVFTLGYLLGRSQYDSRLRAAVGKLPEAGPPTAGSPPKSKGKAESEEAAPSQTGSDWDFYHSAEPKTTEDHLQPPKKTVVAAQPAASKHAPAKSTTPAKSSPPLNAPLIAKGAIMLQVAAVQRESDALALAQALQQKKFPAFVITPGTDKYYRVQVGPYADAQSAATARRDLEAKGFKSIIKR